MVVGLQELRTVFGTYEQFVGDLCNVFKIYDVRRILWNGTLDPPLMAILFLIPVDAIRQVKL